MQASFSSRESYVDDPELVVFAIGLVNFVLKLPDGQVKFFGGIKILRVKSFFQASLSDS